MISVSRQFIPTARAGPFIAHAAADAAMLTEEAINENLSVPNGTLVVVPKDPAGVAGPRDESS
jgi:hypothetical protein